MRMAGKTSKGEITWNCLCDCGTERVVRGAYLRNGTSTSCGCFRREFSSVMNRTHGLSNSPEYAVWCSMHRRCRDKNCESYKNYGARGIMVCERWDKFENFILDMGRRPGKLTLERKNNSLGYFPENCCWATSKVQGNNRRTNRLVEFNGKFKTITQWAQEIGLSSNALWKRIKSGYSVCRALTEPFIPREKRTKLLRFKSRR